MVGDKSLACRLLLAGCRRRVRPRPAGAYPNEWHGAHYTIGGSCWTTPLTRRDGKSETEHLRQTGLTMGSSESMQAVTAQGDQILHMDAQGGSVDPPCHGPERAVMRPNTVRGVLERFGGSSWPDRPCGQGASPSAFLSAASWADLAAIGKPAHATLSVWRVDVPLFDVWNQKPDYDYRRHPYQRVIPDHIPHIVFTTS